MAKNTTSISSCRSIVLTTRRFLLSCTAFTVCAGHALSGSTVTYTYDERGRVVSVNYPDASTVTYQYDSAGNRIQLTKAFAAPTVSPVAFSVPYNTTANVTLPAQGNYTSIAVVSPPQHGTVSITNGIATYTPTSGYLGADSFTFAATGPGGTSAPATASITVPTPAAPVVGNRTLSVGFNTSGSIVLTPSGAYNSVAVATAPANGAVAMNGSTATYTPNTNYFGSDSFTYTASGPGGTSSPGTVAVTVANPNAPTVANVSMTTAYNSAGSVALSPSGIYSSLAVASGPAHGSASISGTTATYTPTAGYYGSDSFTYTATGAGGTSAPATVSVTVGLPPAPSVGNVSMTTAYNTAGSVGLSPSGVYSSLSVATGPTHGSASISGTTATYTPTAGYYGADSFTYKATGPGGTSTPATVSVTVATPATPTVGNVSMTTAYNTSGSVVLSPSGVYTSLAVASGPAHGSASISGTTATYTPAAGYSGADSFTYTAAGPGGSSTPATVSVTVQPMPVVTINLSSSSSDLRAVANSNGYTGSTTVQYQFIVPAGTTIQGASNGGRALATGTWPAGVTLTLIVSGNIYGGGGNGGKGGWTTSAATAGTAGGDAVYVQAPIAITVNSGGSIKSGGGGGGGGTYAGSSTPGGFAGSGGGGGGGGFPNGSGGLGAAGTPTSGANGSAGTTAGGGAAGGYPLGGAGGGAGSAGAAGSIGNGTPGAGGAAGYAVRKNGQTVTVTNNGTVNGTIG